MAGVVAAEVATAATTAAIAAAAVSVITATDVQLSLCDQIIST